MTITQNKEGARLTIALEGRLDTTTAPQLESEIGTALDGVKELVFDMSKLEYISSAGLRVFLAAQQTMNSKGTMTVCGSNEALMEIFEVTGFVDILNIEQ